MRVFQLLPTLARGDAVSNDAVALRGLLAQQGVYSHIYAERWSDGLDAEGLVRPAASLPHLLADDVLIYHLSTGSALNEQLSGMRCRKVCVYHNITPPEYFLTASPMAYRLTAEGRRQARALAGVFDYCLADSDYNRQDLLSMGWTCPIDVLPILIPFEEYDAPWDTAVQSLYRDKKVNVLFTGRVAPNKKQEDVIRAFSLFQRTWQPDSRLILLGGHGGPGDAYYEGLQNAVAATGAQNVVFTGHVPFAQVLSFYRMADVFLCMSAHEGFCVPLVEAMHFGVPVVACPGGAVEETLAGAGLFLPSRSPALAASAPHRVLTDSALRAALLESQRARLQALSYEAVGARFLALFSAFCGGKV